MRSIIIIDSVGGIVTNLSDPKVSDIIASVINSHPDTTGVIISKPMEMVTNLIDRPFSYLEYREDLMLLLMENLDSILVPDPYRFRDAIGLSSEIILVRLCYLNMLHEIRFQYEDRWESIHMDTIKIGDKTIEVEQLVRKSS